MLIHYSTLFMTQQSVTEKLHSELLYAGKILDFLPNFAQLGWPFSFIIDLNFLYRN